MRSQPLGSFLVPSVAKGGRGKRIVKTGGGRRNLIMRHLLTVRGSPFRANPAKWRGWRQPNNQAINHERGARRRPACVAWVPVYVTRKPASCRISTSKHARGPRSSRKANESTELTRPFSRTVLLGDEKLPRTFHGQATRLALSTSCGRIPRVGLSSAFSFS